MKERILKGTRKTLIVLVAVVLILALFEIAVRMFFPQVLNYTMFDENLMFKHIPLYTFRYFSTEFDNVITFNSQGLKDYEHSYEKKPGTYRILVLGDSLPIGFQVAMNETFPKILEQKLNAGNRAETHKNYEIINAGVGGYGSENELLYYETEGKKYSPDMVLLAFTMSDIDENLVSPLITIDNGTLVRHIPVKSPLLKNAALYCSRYSHLCAWTYNNALRGLQKSEALRTLFGKLRLSTKGEKGQATTKSELDIYKRENSSTLQKGLNETFFILVAFNAELEKDNVTLVIVPIPQVEQVDKGMQQLFVQTYKLSENDLEMEKFQHITRSFAASNSISYINPLQYLKAKNSGNALYFNEGGHFKQEGHEAMADYIYSELKRQGVLG